MLRRALSASITRAGKQVTADGKLIAKAKMPAVAEGLADRLNEEDYRKEQDKWSA